MSGVGRVGSTDVGVTPGRGGGAELQISWCVLLQDEEPKWRSRNPQSSRDPLQRSGTSASCITRLGRLSSAEVADPEVVAVLIVSCDVAEVEEISGTAACVRPDSA